MLKRLLDGRYNPDDEPGVLFDSARLIMRRVLKLTATRHKSLVSGRQST